MRESGRDARLILEHRDELWIARIPWKNALDGQALLEPARSGACAQVDFGHSARRDARDELVGSNGWKRLDPRVNASLSAPVGNRAN